MTKRSILAMSVAMPEPTAHALRALETEFLRELSEVAARPNGAKLDALQRLRSVYFGPKGQVTLLARGVGQLPPEERPLAGKEINRVRQTLEGALTEAIARLEADRRDEELRRSRLDMTLPGRAPFPRGAVHPVYRVVYEITDIFVRMGFEVASGPEVELDLYNFESLNFPTDHPARDMQDTFFVSPPDARRMGELVLRTHTSPVQVRSMEKQGAPIRIISPGRVYRCDSDATHSPMFHQIEGLWVDEGVSFAHLKGVLTSFLNAFFGASTKGGRRKVRFRPSYFPFVEPGAEVDIECVLCGGEGCRICKQSGWMEILGAGMVHPAVLEACRVDPERYTGFAFGLGVDRIAMLRWRIDDLAHLFRSDIRFLSQL